MIALSSCRGSWSLENHSKVNGVHVDTYVNYSESVEQSSESRNEVPAEDHCETESGDSQ